MKTKIYTLALASALSLGLASCSDDWQPGLDSDANGQARMTDINVVNAATVVSRAGVDTSNFIVTVVDADGKEAGTWTYSQMPEIITLPVGTGYQVNVISHNQEKAAWEAPYFTGSSAKFDIKDSQITEIGTVTCRLANIKVSIRFTEALKAAMGDDCKVTVVANDEGRLEFTKNETRSGYFQALEGSSTLVATFTGTVNGNFETIVRPFTDVEAGQHRIITYGIQTGGSHIPDETGYVDPSSGITIDDSVIDETIEGNVNPGDEDVIGGDRPGKEDPENPDEPTPDKPTPDEPSDDVIKVTSSTIDLEAENTPQDGVEYKVKIDTENPMTHLIVEIISESLSDEMLRGVGLAAKFDLADPQDLKEALSGSFGFPVEDEVVGQTSVVFDITNFVPLLNIYKGELHQFKLTIDDNAGNEKIVTLKFRT